MPVRESHEGNRSVTEQSGHYREHTCFHSTPFSTVQDPNHTHWTGRLGAINLNRHGQRLTHPGKSLWVCPDLSPGNDTLGKKWLMKMGWCIQIKW